ncbi:MAG: class I SAM-dependent methyltransferase [Chitinophagales bacterium]|jgi:ubiquinone/menaquinone biosynthesis C-methylase UbiE|nr:class I SAM-dependent methyltransferase [Chitinophagales bacterium]
MQSTNYIPALKYNWLTKFYDGLIENFLRENFFKTALINQATVPNPKSIIDIGSGTGTLTLMLHKKFPDAVVFGIDGDENIIRIANQKNNSSGKVHFQQGMSYNLPNDENSADITTSSLMLHHLTDADKVRTLRECLRVLKPNGEMLIADWGKASNSLMRLLFYIVQLLDGFETTSSNTKGMVVDFMKHAGFQQVHICQKIDTLLGTIDIYKGTKQN